MLSCKKSTKVAVNQLVKGQTSCLFAYLHLSIGRLKDEQFSQPKLINWTQIKQTNIRQDNISHTGQQRVNTQYKLDHGTISDTELSLQ